MWNSVSRNEKVHLVQKNFTKILQCNKKYWRILKGGMDSKLA